MENSQNNVTVSEKEKLKLKKKQQKEIEKQNKCFNSKMRFYKVLVWILTGIIRVLFRMKINGRENMPKDGACFVCCNHLSNWDPIFLAISVKRPVHFMANKEIFSVPVLKNIVTLLGAFPVDRETADITAIKTALNHIKHGNALGIFPQGTRCRGKAPETLPIKSGTGMMVYKTESDVVPVSIYTKGYKIFLFKRVYVEIGKPIKFEEYNAGEKSPAEYQRISDIIFGRICAQVHASEAEADSKKADS